MTLGKDGWPTDETVIRTRDTEIESLQARVAELTETCVNHAQIENALSEELAALKREKQHLINGIGQGEPKAWMFKVWDGRRLNEFAAIDYEPQKHDVYGWEVLKDKQPLYTQAPAIPEGWQLVPIEPTPEMIEAGRNAPMILAGNDEDDAPQDYINVYEAMLSAAPKQGGTELEDALAVVNARLAASNAPGKPTAANELNEG